MSAPNYRRLAEELCAKPLSLIEHVLTQHTAAVLEQMHVEMRQTSDELASLKEDAARIVRERTDFRRDREELLLLLEKQVTERLAVDPDGSESTDRAREAIYRMTGRHA